ncbi:LamG-like jellyroll fold domain-containing protein [Streptomyces sp. NPDC001046]|uniref:LamG-like jellyroll fold domain-containing protein n=1 Tax=Streptomyces sp. NPDC001046 TaxID=3364543 RepID=UPI003681E0E4
MDVSDLTLARRAVRTGWEADAAMAELTERHLDAVLAYAARCTTTPQAAAFLSSAACEAAVREFLSHGTETAWRPHVLGAVLRTAVEWSLDERRDRLGGELLIWLSDTGTGTASPVEDEPSLLVTAFYRLPVHIQVALWHNVVEHDEPAAVARHLGVARGAVLPWTAAAESRLWTALTEVLGETAGPACGPYTRLLLTAAQAEDDRAAAASATGGLDEHLASCPSCSRALRDLRRVRNRPCGELLADALLLWDGIRYHQERPSREERTAREGGHPTERRPEGPLVRARQRAGLPWAAGRLPWPRNGRYVLFAGAVVALAALTAWMALPEGGTGDDPRVVSLPTVRPPDVPVPGAEPSASTSGGRGTDAPQGSERPRDEPDEPRPSPSPSPRVSPLTVPDAALRWDFAGPGPKPGTPGGRSVKGVRHSGQRAGSAEFDGTGYVASRGAVADTEGDFTVSAWARLTSTADFQTVAAQDGENVSGFFLQYGKDDNRWRLAVGHSDSADDDECDALSSAPPKVGQWQHLTAVFDADDDEIRLYVDGVLQETDEHTPAWSARGAFTVGRGLWEGKPADVFHGGIDDVRVYDRALGASDVAALAKARPNS